MSSYTPDELFCKEQLGFFGLAVGSGVDSELIFVHLVVERHHICCQKDLFAERLGGVVKSVLV